MAAFKLLAQRYNDDQLSAMGGKAPAPAGLAQSPPSRLRRLRLYRPCPGSGAVHSEASFFDFEQHDTE
jgi:hypothetical protein